MAIQVFIFLETSVDILSPELSDGDTDILINRNRTVLVQIQGNYGVVVTAPII